MRLSQIFRALGIAALVAVTLPAVAQARPMHHHRPMMHHHQPMMHRHHPMMHHHRHM